jgi:uncharacterized protein YigE (DUF2233 family)
MHRQQFQLALKDAEGNALQSFRRLRADLRRDAFRVQFAMNAGMFDAASVPVGLLVQQRKVVHPLNSRDGTGNFFLKPNGVFWVDGSQQLHLQTTESFSAHTTTPIFATQSGPMLVVNGRINPKFGPDGISKFVRNGVGLVDSSDALFVISNQPVSFGRFARFFRDRLGCKTALYFDGAVSSLWIPAEKREDSVAPLGPMIVVLRPN